MSSGEIPVGRRVEAMPPAADCVLRERLEQGARDHPDRVLATFASGDPPWTYAQALTEARALAAVFAGLGVRRGDSVAVWLPNGRAGLTAWFAANLLGAVYAPLNLAYRGRILEHALRVAHAAVLVAHPDLAASLVGVDCGPVRVVVSEGGRAPAGLPAAAPGDAELAAAGLAYLDQVGPIRPWDTQALVFTSGTTGPSKGVRVSYLQTYLSACSHPFPLDPTDRGLVHSPLFHVSGIGPVVRALAAGGGFALVERFRTDTFWEDVRRTGATYASMMGSMATFLLSRPPSTAERTSGLKILLLNPLNAETRQVAARAGCDFYTVFSMSEVSVPVLTGLNPDKLGICGRPRPGVEARIVDEADVEVDEGEVGQLVLRTDLPWAFTSGYEGDDGATAAAWRNGWFHTGDAVRRDADGDLIFVDRLKDAIRRRGENVSSYEVELEVRGFADVADCAAVAVPSEHGDDEVLLAVEPCAGGVIEPEALFRFLEPRLPHFMLPRFIRVVATLPRTQTEKVQKARLRAEGVTADAWDREAAGITVTRRVLDQT